MSDSSRRQHLKKLVLQNSKFIRRPATLVNALMREERKLERTIHELDFYKRHSVSHMDSEIDFFRKKNQETLEVIDDDDDKFSVASEAGSDISDVEDESQKCKPKKHFTKKCTDVNLFGAASLVTDCAEGLADYHQKSSRNASHPRHYHHPQHFGCQHHAEKAPIVNVFHHEDRIFHRSKANEFMKRVTMHKKAHEHCLENGDQGFDRQRSLKTAAIPTERNSNSATHISHGKGNNLKIYEMENTAHSPDLFHKPSYSHSTSPNVISCYLNGSISGTPPERRRTVNAHFSHFSTIGAGHSFTSPRRLPEHSRISLSLNPMLFHPRFNNFTDLPEDDYNSFQALRKCRYLRIPQRHLAAEINSSLEC